MGHALLVVLFVAVIGGVLSQCGGDDEEDLSPFVVHARIQQIDTGNWVIRAYDNLGRFEEQEVCEVEAEKLRHEWSNRVYQHRIYCARFP